MSEQDFDDIYRQTPDHAKPYAKPIIEMIRQNRANMEPTSLDVTQNTAIPAAPYNRIFWSFVLAILLSASAFFAVNFWGQALFAVLGFLSAVGAFVEAAPYFPNAARRIQRFFIWLVVVPILIGLGILATVSMGGWLTTIPSWAAVIIVLLLLLLLK